MKQLLRLFLSFFIFPAFAVTSESYVDSVLNTLQDEIPAENTNAVLMNIGVSGEIGTKKIYDATQSFTSQANALVTAETFNAAIQNAIDNEYVCIEWLGEHIPSNCLLYQIRPVMPKQTLPAAYTQLEYLESSGTQWIDTHIVPNTTYAMQLDFQANYAQNAIYAGTRQAVATDNAFTIGSGNNGTRFYIAKGSSGNQTMQEFDTDRHNVIISETGVIFDDRQLPNAHDQVFQAETSIYLFACNSYDASQLRSAAKIYNAKIWKADLLLGDFVPARRNSDNVLGMYDMVTGTFFTNAGTGTFNAGPDVVSNLYLPSGN